jgi:hypothetical protein
MAGYSRLAAAAVALVVLFELVLNEGVAAAAAVAPVLIVLVIEFWLAFKLQAGSS